MHYLTATLSSGERITFLGLELSILIGISFVAIISCCLAISVYSVNMIVQDIILDKKKQKLVEKYKDAEDLEKEKEKKLEDEEEKKQEELEKKAEEKWKKDEEDRLKRRGMPPV